MSNKVTFLDGKADEFIPSGRCAYSITDKQYKKQYCNAEQQTKLKDVLAGIDKGEAMSTLFASVQDDWRDYVAPLFLPQVHFLDIKIPDWSAQLVPQSLSVNRDPAFYVGVDSGEGKAKPKIGFIAKGASHDKTMHELVKKSEALRRWGTGWRIDREDLNDIPIDIVSQRLRVYEADRRKFKNNWATAVMYEATSGTYEATYANTFSCLGTYTTGKDYHNEETAHHHGISIEDVLKAKYEFRTRLQNPDEQPMGRTVRGQDYYQAEFLVLPPLHEQSLALELFRMGYKQAGPEDMSSQVRRLGFISEVFGMTVVPAPTCRWPAGETKVPETWDYANDAYILDSRAFLELVHSEGTFSQNWFIEDTRQFCWAVTQRTNYVVDDAMAVMRLEPASGS